MRYPASGDIIHIHTCMISLLTNQLTVFSRAVKHLWFSVVWSFRNFCASPFEFASRSLVSFEFIIKWRQAGLSRSQMRNWIRRRKRKSEYKVEDCVRSRFIQNNFFQTSNSDLLDSTSLHERIDEHLSEFIFNWRSQKRWLRLIGTHKFERITFKHPEISELWLHIFYWRCVFKTTTMATLKAKQKEPKAKGLGSKPRTSDSLNDEEIEKLYASKCLGKLSSHYKQFVAKFDLTFQPSRRQTDRESDAGEMSNPSKRPTEKSICCIGRILCNKKKTTWSLGDTKFLFSCWKYFTRSRIFLHYL